MITWSIWLARNAHLFEDMIIPTFQCAMQSVSILIHFPQDKKVKNPRDIIPIDTTTKLTFRCYIFIIQASIILGSYLRE